MSVSVIRGKVWKFGDNISTDLMQPGFTQGQTLEERAMFCMRANRPEFAGEVRPGDVIVAGRNFGCGSARPAARNLKTLGIGCVIAESVARIFFRGSINEGFPILYCKGVTAIFKEGDTLEVNLLTGEVKNLTTGKAIKMEPLPEIAINILNAGGVLELLRQEFCRK